MKLYVEASIKEANLIDDIEKICFETTHYNEGKN